MSGILEAVSFREFWAEDQIKKLVTEYVNHAAAAFHKTTNSVDPAGMSALLIFSTSKQQTWLVVDQLSLRCVLDDRRREAPRVQWAIKIDEAEPIRADYDYSRDSGILYIGSRTKEWLFSKRLFQTTSVVEAVRKLLSCAQQ